MSVMLEQRLLQMKTQKAILSVIEDLLVQNNARPDQIFEISFHITFEKIEDKSVLSIVKTSFLEEVREGTC
jgi:hypothetical protein